MSVLKMSVLTFILAMGFSAYAWSNWPQEKMRLNDYKDNHEPGTINLDEWNWEVCRDCGGIRERDGACYNQSCPSNR